MTPDPIPDLVAAKKIKVAVLGGGPGGISAAFWLTATPELRARYEVVVYTPGWRLGGKCATGRNLGMGARIQEHGLHILMGCYTEAFRTIRSCYDEWQPRPGGPYKTWTDAFSAQRQVTLQERVAGATPPAWTGWNFVFPKLPGEPGDPIAPTVSPDPHAELERLAAALAAWAADHLDAHIPPELLEGTEHRSALSHFASLALHNAGPDIDAVRQALGRVAGPIRDAISALPNDTATARDLAARDPESPASPGFVCPLACKLVLADLALSVVIGWARDILPHGAHGIDLLNVKDFRQWLRSCGATETALASAPIRALYDLSFAFRNGDSSSIDNGSIAAGVTLRFMLEATLGYRDAPLWKMNAGTGDTVFTPFYQVLRARGVRIEFFQRVTGVALTADASRIGSIALDQQANVSCGAYQPFVPVGGLDCWPDRPLWEQLDNGAALGAQGVNFEAPADTTVARSWQLELGRDFDLVVLAVPPEVIKTIAPQLAAQSTPWRTMVAQSASVATEAFQLWLRPDLRQLGWTWGPTVLTAYAEPFDSWADMSALLLREAWPVADAPRSIEYFCGCIPLQHGRVPDPERDANAWLARSIATLWPNAASRGGPIHPGLLVSGYYRVNTDGSERYVQTPAGSVAYRLSPSAPVFGNLYLAGDWTLTRFSGGCFESAIESGRLAAAAISGAA